MLSLTAFSMPGETGIEKPPCPQSKIGHHTHKSLTKHHLAGTFPRDPMPPINLQIWRVPCTQFQDRVSHKREVIQSQHRSLNRKNELISRRFCLLAVPARRGLRGASIRGIHVKEKSLKKAQNLIKAKDSGCGGHCSTCVSHHRLAAFDGFLPPARGHKIGHHVRRAILHICDKVSDRREI